MKNTKEVKKWTRCEETHHVEYFFFSLDLADRRDWDQPLEKELLNRKLLYLWDKYLPHLPLICWSFQSDNRHILRNLNRHSQAIKQNHRCPALSSTYYFTSFFQTPLLCEAGRTGYLYPSDYFTWKSQDADGVAGLFLPLPRKPTDPTLSFLEPGFIFFPFSKSLWEWNAGESTGPPPLSHSVLSFLACQASRAAANMHR